MPFFHILLFVWGEINPMQLQFTSVIFLTVMIILFQLSPGALRKYVLIAGSVVFIVYEGGWYALVALLLISLLTWGTGVLVFSGDRTDEGTKKVRSVLAAAVIVLLLVILFGWKYIPWIMALRGLPVVGGILGLPVPIGLSFYTFGAISYIADLSRGELLPVKRADEFVLYMIYFPKILSGPIERAGAFLEQLGHLGKIRSYSFQRLAYAFSYIVWGFAMKLIIADRIAVAVDAVFEDPSSFGSAALILASFLYTVQIYCDFAAYSNLAVGVSRIFGIDLVQNFKTPYMAENITDFWRRWHISLSSFLKDYIYIPLGGSRRGRLIQCINTAVVFLVCGMWHGAGLSFILWGMIHAALSMAVLLIKNSRAAFLTKGRVGRFITFFSVSFAWIFFRAPSVTKAFIFVRGMLPSLNPNALFAGIKCTDGLVLNVPVIGWLLFGIGILILTAADYMAYKKNTTPPAMLIEGMSSYRRVVLMAIIFSIVLIFGEYGSGAEIREFVYMNF